MNENEKSLLFRGKYYAIYIFPRKIHTIVMFEFSAENLRGTII